MKCPYCGSGEFWPSRKRLPEALLGALLPYRPFRCRSCLKRYLIPVAWYQTLKRLALPVAAVLVAALVAFILLGRDGRGPSPKEQAAMSPAAAQAAAAAEPPAEVAPEPAPPEPAAAPEPAPAPRGGQQTALFRLYLDIAPEQSTAGGGAP